MIFQRQIGVNTREDRGDAIWMYNSCYDRSFANANGAILWKWCTRLQFAINCLAVYMLILSYLAGCSIYEYLIGFLGGLATAKRGYKREYYKKLLGMDARIYVCVYTH